MGASLNQFNLNYKFNSKLRPVMEDPESVNRYISFLQERLTIVKPDQPEADKIQVKLLGEIGAYAKDIGKVDLSLQTLQKSLNIIEEKNLGLRQWATHTLRYADALRYKKEFLAAETGFRSVLTMIGRHPELRDFEDFAWQHLGKLKFDEGQLKAATECFEKAKEIRVKKGIKELLESTEYALKVTQIKATNKKKY